MKQKLRVWHIPQVPMNPFYVPVENVEQAKLILRTLWSYDSFQFDQNIKPDYTNASGLEQLEYGEWFEWSDDSGSDISEVIDEDHKKEHGSLVCPVFDRGEQWVR